MITQATPENFRCPYHSWRYGTDGDLIYAPHQEGFQEGLPEQTICLPKVRCEEALGFYWINLDTDAEPLDVFLRDMLPIMEHYEFRQPHAGAGPDRVDQLQLEGGAR
jgi:phenylpropionate dioxygenase-like ring-hydroxylating dioxygenase large terminal subunit